MRVNIVGETRRDEQITPIALRQIHSVLQLLQIAVAQLECRDANPVQSRRSLVGTEWKVCAAFLDEKRGGHSPLFPRKDKTDAETDLRC